MLFETDTLGKTVAGMARMMEEVLLSTFFSNITMMSPCIHDNRSFAEHPGFFFVCDFCDAAAAKMA